MKNLLFSCFLFAICAVLHAQEGFRNQSVSVFKNASAFMVKSGTVEMSDKFWLWQSESLPLMLEGTFWAAAPDNSLLAVKSLSEAKETKRVMNSFADMLDINDGKRVRLHFNGDSSIWEGTIRITKDGQQVSSLYALKTNKGSIVYFSPAEIANLRRVEFLEEPNTTKASSSLMPTLRFEFKNQRPSQILSLMYLQNNIAWNPEYKIELLDAQKASISMWATVTNEAEDFDTEELNLVAGLPNFKNAKDVHRFLKHILATPAVAAASTRIAAATHSNLSNYSSFSNSAMGSNFTEIAPIEISTDDANALSTSTVGDMYYYTLKNVKLKKGERAVLNVFEAKIPITHIYQTTLPTNSSGYTEVYTNPTATHKVEHSLQLKNNSPYVWTAGTAFITSNEGGKISPISQDALYYTAQQQTREIYLTQSPDIIVRSSERQKDRRQDDKKVASGSYDYFYDLVTVTAEIEIQNFKNEPIQLDLKRTIVGELMTSSETWETVKLVIDAKNLNNTNRVDWKVKIGAGEKKTLTYNYKMYVQRRSVARKD